MQKDAHSRLTLKILVGVFVLIGWQLHISNNHFVQTAWGASGDPLGVSIGAEKLDRNILKSMNPIEDSKHSDFKNGNDFNPGGAVSRLVKNIIFPASGLILFLYIIWGGYQIIKGGLMGKDADVSAGKQRTTAAIVGFLLLFGSYWMWSLVELAFGLGTT